MKNDNTALYALLAGAGVLALISSSETVQEEIKKVFSGTPTEFTKKFYVPAILDRQKTGVPALFTLAQAGLESNWGKSAYGNNFFGIKAGKGWTGSTQKLKTWECGKTGNASLDGIKDEIIAVYPPNDPNGICGNLYSYRVYGEFRKYVSPEEGFADHSKFLLTNPRYKNAFQYEDPINFGKEVAKAGYATVANYGQLITDTINKVKTLVA